MNLNTRLEEESLFFKNPSGIEIIRSLNDQKIYTIEDFINCNVEKIKVPNFSLINQYRTFQKILRTKYLDEPLPFEDTLSKEYKYTNGVNFDLLEDTIKLGYGNQYFGHCLQEILLEKGYCRMIDIISMLDKSYEYLSEFYIEYYNNLNKSKTK